jgi:excisionase family DNA binding protein
MSTPAPTPSVPKLRDALAQNGLTLDALIDALAERIAARIRANLTGNQSEPARPRLLTVEQAGGYLGRSKEAVEHMIASGKIATVRIDRRVFVDVRDLDRLIEDSKVNGIR